MAEFTAKKNDDGTFSLEVDGIPFDEGDDAKTTLTRESLAALINDARQFFGDITVTEPDGDEPAPVPELVPAPPVPPAPDVPPAPVDTPPTA